LKNFWGWVQPGPNGRAGPSHPCGLTKPCTRKILCVHGTVRSNYITFALFILRFLQIAVINRVKTKWRSFGLLSSPVSFCFSRQNWRQLLRRKDMNIPASGERKPMVVLTSPAVFAFWLRRSICPTAVPLLFGFYILMRPSFVFPEFLTVFSPLFFFLLSRFPCLVLFLPSFVQCWCVCDG